MMSAIEDHFEKVEDRMSFDEFSKLIDEKRTVMGSLCDDDTLCMMILQELGVDTLKKISEITADSGKVSIKVRVLSVSEVREFSRDDGSTGKVANLIVGDETGSIRAVLWDDSAGCVATREIAEGISIGITGFARGGENGVEVHLGRFSTIKPLDYDVEVKIKHYQIADIAEGMVSINLRARVIDVGSTRSFKRRDGGEGKVRNITLGDETGKINITLWDERTEVPFGEDDTIEVRNAYAKKNNYTGKTELQLSREGVVEQTEADIGYNEKITPITDIEIDRTYSIRGFVSGIGEIREFTRRDGGVGQVANMHVSDDTGRIRVTLWGDHAEVVDEIDIGSEVLIIDAQTRTGFSEEVELNLNWNSKVRVLKR
ncbi:replication factor A [Methanosarcinales archaeon ex4572_44]|nr:MAG: replication factor A [Methanosarcinales archaeon ex4572_44]RLG27261.1 MAG: replication factor A [Methanosarcinales archaeon]